MDKKLFGKLTDSLEEAVEISKGKKKPSRVFKYNSMDVKKIRNSLHFSQSRFAGMIGVSVRTLQNWEQGRRKPVGSARALLKVVESNPKLVIKALHY